MEELESLVIRAQSGELKAYGEIVRRFQDMAYGYAYSVLGDFHLAEDAVQEAFVEAYQCLAALRGPAAFPGWFRRIVFKHCDRITRQQLLERRAADELAAVPSSEPGPSEVVERREMRDTVLRAIRALPEHQRMAVTLFYIDGYAQREIAEFLEVPVSTVKSRLHASRKRLKEGMMGMVEEHLRQQRLRPDFKQEIMKRIAHWKSFSGSVDENLKMVEADPEWTRLVEVEMELEPVSQNCRMIRKLIACMEACHEHYLENVQAALQMIGSMTPRPPILLWCGQACAARQEQAKTYAEALQLCCDLEALPDDANDCTREVFELLGVATEAKQRLVVHLIGKLRDNGYEVYAEKRRALGVRGEDEDFDLTEARIQHLDICNYNWKQNLRIVLQEIAAGRRLFDWHVPDGYNAHGDCPDRVSELRDIILPAVAWAEGNPRDAGKWGPVLGEPTQEKRWLVASLCKHVSAQHQSFGGDQLLPRPSL